MGEKTGYYYYDEKGQEHLHTFEGQPLIGTSTALKVLNKPLSYWASGLAVKEFGCTDPKILTKIKNKKATTDEVKEMFASVGIMHEKIKQMTVEQYLKLVDKAYRAHASSLKDSQKSGVDLHAELERYVKDVMAKDWVGKTYDPKIQPFIAWSQMCVEKFIASEIHCFSTKHWLGGISDAIALLKDGRTVVIDFKSSTEAYLSHKWQACGYALQFEENGGFTFDGVRILEPIIIDSVIIFPFGAEEIKPNFYVDMDGGKEAFLACLLLHKKLPSND